MWRGLFLVCVAAIAVAAVAQQTLAPDPFAVLRDGYAQADPDRAAQAYAPDAHYFELYPGTSPVVRTGRSAIRDGFAALFRDLDLGAKRRADLNFRASSDGSGYYRLRIPGEPTAYGKFATVVRDSRFTIDVSGPASRDEFEDAPGPLRFNDADEELDSGFYDRPLGRYLTSGRSCGLVLTRSVRRYFLFDECTGSWRGLNRVAGRRWTAGARVLDAAGKTLVALDPAKGGLTLASRNYARVDTAARTAVTFESDVALAGTLYRPVGSDGLRRPAALLIHGSGPQDRNGYASLMAVYAEQLVQHGFVVLAFDKRGTGGSAGDWNAAGFDQLGGDAAAGLRFLRDQPGVDPARVGVMGSSQAGWVAAAMIRAGANPAFTILIGAAGSALTVTEQNLYNTEVRMRCANIAKPDIALALAQQRAFFDAKRDPRRQAALTAASARAASRPPIADWVFPATIGRSERPEWYDVLDPAFDPLPVWRNYRGRAYFAFGQHDDSTPAMIAAARLRGLSNATVAVIPDAQHIGLEAAGPCRGELDATARFHPRYLATLDGWLARIALSH